MVCLLIAWKELDDKSSLAASLIGAAGLVLFIPLKLGAGRFPSWAAKLVVAAVLFIWGMAQSQNWSENAAVVAHPLPHLDTAADVSCSPDHIPRTACTASSLFHHL